MHKQSQYLDIYGTKIQKGPFLDDANFGRFLLTLVILQKRKSFFQQLILYLLSCALGTSQTWYQFHDIIKQFMG